MDADRLLEVARKARESAYAPYSGYRVGAAAMDESGRIFAGCNVENVSFPAGLCAERVAIGSLIAGGGTRVQAIAVATQDGGMPCGVCLQTILEFAAPGATRVYAFDQAGLVREFRFSELMPHGFSSKDVRRENQSEG